MWLVTEALKDSDELHNLLNTGWEPFGCFTVPGGDVNSRYVWYTLKKESIGFAPEVEKMKDETSKADL